MPMWMVAVSSETAATDEVRAYGKGRSCALVPAALRWASLIRPALPAIITDTLQNLSVRSFGPEIITSGSEVATEADSAMPSPIALQSGPCTGLVDGQR